MHKQQTKTQRPESTLTAPAHKPAHGAAAVARLPAWASGVEPAPGLFAQAKLEISQPDDPYEQEADQVAEQVMHTPEPAVQRRCACGSMAGPDGECAACRAARMAAQRKAAVPTGPTA